MWNYIGGVNIIIIFLINSCVNQLISQLVGSLKCESESSPSLFPRAQGGVLKFLVISHSPKPKRYSMYDDINETNSHI